MPIPVVCDNCQTRLNAPDAAAGKKVRCPKCQTVMSVPDATAVAPPPLPPPPPAGGAFDFGAAVSSAAEPKGRGDRPRRRDDDDAPRSRRPRDEEPDDRPRRPRPRDEEPDDDDRPRRRPETKSKLPMLLLVGGFLLLTCCGGGGFGVYYAVGKLKEEGERRKAENDAKEKQLADELKRRAGGGDANRVGGAGGPPAGWTTFDAPDQSVRAAFPAPFPDDGGLAFQTPTTTGAKSWQTMESDGSLTCIVGVVKFRPASKAADREKDLRTAVGLMNLAAKDVSTPKTVDWLGGQAKEYSGTSALVPGTTIVTRSVVVGDAGYVAMVIHKNKPDMATTFINNIQVPPK